MKIEKKVFATLEKGYTVKPFYRGETLVLGYGPEIAGAIRLYLPDQDRTVTISDGPGGMMSLHPYGSGEAPFNLISIMGLLPPFLGQGAAIYHHSSSSGLDGEWQIEKVLDLPFAHRVEVLHRNSEDWFVAASVAKHKDNPEDWSQPGTVYIGRFPQSEGDEWEMKPIKEGLTRNHGMTKTVYNGEETLFFSGKEGLFRLDVNSAGQWISSLVIETEVSEVGVADFDGDGRDEIVTIEPFHGNKLRVYKQDGTQWNKIFETELSFGHGLWVGTFQQQPTIFVGSRSDDMSLMQFRFDPEKSDFQKTVIEENVGPTQIDVFTNRGIDYIVSSNQNAGEMAIYTIS